MGQLDATNICLQYVNSRTNATVVALKDISLSVNDGEFVSIIGPSGCGKSTFLYLVDGLLSATSGRMTLDGNQIMQPGPDRAMVFQDASLLPWRTVLRNVTYGVECRKMPLAQATDRARHYINMVGLGGFENSFPYELSGGMQQRVNLARALTSDPQLLLMDEPFAALDAQTREVMQGDLLQIWRQAKKTVLFVTHQIDEAAFLSDRVLVFTARPGHVKESVVIDIERPRDLRMKREHKFHEVENYLSGLIEEEVRASMSEARAAPQLVP